MASSNRNRMWQFAGIVLAGVTSGLLLDWIRNRRRGM